MSTYKTKVSEEEVKAFLQSKFTSELSNFEFIKGGESSQAFSFQIGAQQFILRVNKDDLSYKKDYYAFEHFSNKNLPIPKVTEIGTFNEKLFYALSERSIGRNLDEFKDDEILEIMPSLISVLDTIHAFPVKGEGYGYWNTDGIAEEESWGKYITDNEYVFEKEAYATGILEKDVAEKIIKAIRILSDCLPERRDLVHGDYGFSNVISDGKGVTGVLDWGESLYGDFLYDVAWLTFWSATIPYDQILRKHYEERNVDITDYEQRLICYQLKLGLGALNFFAGSEQQESYNWTRDKLLVLAAQSTKSV